MTTLAELLQQKALEKTVQLLRENSKKVVEILKEYHRFD